MPDDLQAEIDAALGGLSLDEIVGNQSAATPTSSRLENESRHRGQVVEVHGDNVFFTLGGKNQGVCSLRNFAQPPEPGQVIDEIYTKLGQLDFAAELAQVRAAKPEAVYIFQPGGMGINFIKQWVAAGLNKQMVLVTPGFSADEDVIKAVGEPMLGMYNTAHWAHDLGNAENRKFVADFQKEYGRTPTVYAAQGYDTARMLDAAVRDAKGKIEDKAAFGKALAAANFKSVRGEFKFNVNHFPIQNYYLRQIWKDPSGRITNKLVSTVLTNHPDAYAPACKMKPW